MKRLYLDLETTGISAKQCSIVQIAVIVEIDDEVKDSLSIFVKPFEGCVIEPGAIALSDIIPKAQVSGELYKDAYRKVIKLLDSYVDKYNKRDKFFLIGYNVGFDDSFLRELWRRCNDSYYGSWFWWPPLDVAVLACQYLRHERRKLENFKLSTLADYLNIERQGAAHDALSDVHLTMKIYKRVSEV